jgi:hypothetical protein
MFLQGSIMNAAPRWITLPKFLKFRVRATATSFYSSRKKVLSHVQDVCDRI